MSPAQAEEAPAPATLSFQYSGLKRTRTVTEYTGVTDRDFSITSLLTGDLVDSFLYMTFDGKLSVYFYPFQDANALVSIGYMIQDNWELGVDFGMNATRIDEPKNDLRSDLYGVFTTYTFSFASFSLENLLVLDFSRTESTAYNENTGVDDKSKVTSTFTKISSTVVVPIARNASYLAGIWLASDQAKHHTLDSTRKSTQLGLMLAGLRITVD